MRTFLHRSHGWQACLVSIHQALPGTSTGAAATTDRRVSLTTQTTRTCHELGEAARKQGCALHANGLCYIARTRALLVADVGFWTRLVAFCFVLPTKENR